MNLSQTLRTASVAAVLASTIAVQAQNLVLDPGFESAAPGAPDNFTQYYNSGQSFDGGSWKVTQGQVGIDVTDEFVYADTRSLYLSAGSGLDAVSQTLSTTPNHVYLVSFWANADSPNSISVLFGGTPIAGFATSVDQNAASGWPGQWTYYSGYATTASASTSLTLLGQTSFPGEPNPATLEIDNVSVTAVPEPAPLLGVGLGVALLLRRRKR